jgi:hypothetical protein
LVNDLIILVNISISGKTALAEINDKSDCFAAKTAAFIARNRGAYGLAGALYNERRQRD